MLQVTNIFQLFPANILQHFVTFHFHIRYKRLNLQAFNDELVCAFRINISIYQPYNLNDSVLLTKIISFITKEWYTVHICTCSLFVICEIV